MPADEGEIRATLPDLFYCGVLDTHFFRFYIFYATKAVLLFSLERKRVAIKCDCGNTFCGSTLFMFNTGAIYMKVEFSESPQVSRARSLLR